MSRDKRLIIGNWKMNLDVHGSSLYLHDLSKKIRVRRDVEVVIAPTMLALQTLSVQVNLRQFKLLPKIFIGEITAHTPAKFQRHSYVVLFNMELLVTQSVGTFFRRLIKIPGQRFRRRFVTEFVQFCALARQFRSALRTKPKWFCMISWLAGWQT